ncbi:MAG: dephospho-CoA kinase [Deltaproteobacteria bacterium]|nr:dephospho-CoA kinase [Deltaproteobacteria bacterium]
MPVPIVGLTGGIACGKSFVASLLAREGVVVVDADQVARDVVAPGSLGLAEVVAAFGPDVLDASGGLDRKKMAARIFAEPADRKRLEAILHPLISMESMRRLASVPESAPYAVYDAALLVENGIHRMLPALVVVTAAPEVQRDRLMARDGIDAESAAARVAAQMPLEQKVAVATHVIDNGDGREQTAAATLAVHRALLERLGRGRGAS